MLDNSPRDYAKVPPDFHVVKFDISEYCDLPHFVKKVSEIVLFDLAERTYVCSLTPSAFGYHVRYDVEFVEEYQNVLSEGDYHDERYSEAENFESEIMCSERSDTYYDYSDIHEIVKKGGENVLAVKVTNEELEEAASSANDNWDQTHYLVEMILEYHNGNHMI